MADALAGAPILGRPNRVLRVLLFAMLGLFVAFYALPLFVMVVTSLKSLNEIRSGSFLGLPAAVTFQPWIDAWVEACIGMTCGGLSHYFLNSVRLTVPAVVITTLVGTLNGYILALWRFRGANLIFGLILFGCFIPFQIILIPMAQVLGFLGLASSTPGLILVHCVYGICFTTLFFRNAYVTFPQELIRAASVDGAGFFAIWWRIVIPSSISIIVVVVIWQFTNIWNDFLFGATFSSSGGQPITVALNNLVNSSTGVKEYNVHMAAAIIAALPTLAIYVLAGRYFVRGLMSGAVKG